MSADKHTAKAAAVAAHVAQKVADTLYPLELAMKRWPAEFRVIMWDAVAHAASCHAQDARSESASAKS